jgi:hypothetical protein
LQEKLLLPDWNSEGSCQSEICEFEFSGFVVNQQILRLQVAMKNVTAVAVGEAAQ